MDSPSAVAEMKLGASGILDSLSTVTEIGSVQAEFPAPSLAVAYSE